MNETKHNHSSMLLVKDQVALVTGAGSGIGKAAALLLAREGAKLCLLSMNNDRLESVKAQIEEAGGEACVIKADVSDPVQVKTALELAVKYWGRLDIVFANAGINGTLAPIEHLKPLDWDKTLDTNLKGTFLTIKYAIPYMKTHGGSIIITSSINGNRTFSGTGMSAYSTSKAGQVAFAKMAALELARYKIRVNVICPGAIETNIEDSTHPTEELKEIEIPVQFPEGSQPLENGPGTPEQVAELVLFLSSRESSHITGTELYIDGGESLLR
ncbi:MAG: short-chain dehydrogenase/reductase [Paenibacillus sp.]|jgi:NAD(P)-dependent dehydrogenase (short-subunit alcohol dehydrogenase family)|nr:short-chain dehydrogenase/reductase [Paenibacillus sp.]